MFDLCFASAIELQRLYRSRGASPREAMDAIYSRIDALNPGLNAYITLAGDAAVEAADRAMYRQKQLMRKRTPA